MANVQVDELAEYLVAKCKLENISITNLKLQKLLFYCQAWHLALEHDKLFSNDVRAWKHGAVVRQVYNKYSEFGYNELNLGNISLTDLVNNLEIKFGETVVRLLNKVTAKYFKYSADELRQINHRETPWLKAREGFSPEDSSDVLIQDEWMEVYYGQNATEMGMRTMTNEQFKFSLGDLIKASKKIEEKPIFKPSDENVEDFVKYSENNIEESKETIWRATHGSDV